METPASNVSLVLQGSDILLAAHLEQNVLSSHSSKTCSLESDVLCKPFSQVVAGKMNNSRL